MLPPRVWGESTEPQNITQVRQNKAPMCARCNNLQCLPCHPKLLEHTVSALPTYTPAGWRAVPPPPQPAWCRVRCQLLLAEMCLPRVLLASEVMGKECLRWSPVVLFMSYAAPQKCFGVCWLYPVVLGRLVTANSYWSQGEIFPSMPGWEGCAFGSCALFKT